MTLVATSPVLALISSVAAVGVVAAILLALPILEAVDPDRTVAG